jgi:geranylgeranyl diphosphate synthase type I
VDEALGAFIGARLAETDDAGEREFVSEIVDLVSRGGKRLRATLCVLGWTGAGGALDDAIVRGAASLELLHACALIHDDVMDRSATRRGGPTLHRSFARRHASGGWRGDSEQFGMGAAIAAGDLCLVWADQLLRESGLAAAAVQRGRPVYDAMRAETIRGQYLDLATQARGSYDIDDALRVARAKTAACTTTGPLCFGGALAGASEPLSAAYQAYGVALGLAFQLRDDLLGAFADPAATGKPSGDDLRDGKCTLLLAEAYQRSDAVGRGRLQELVGRGSAGAVDEIRDLVEGVGARDAVEERITVLGKQAVEALSGAPFQDAPFRDAPFEDAPFEDHGAADDASSSLDDMRGVRQWLVGLVATVTNG